MNRNLTKGLSLILSLTTLAAGAPVWAGGDPPAGSWRPRSISITTERPIGVIESFGQFKLNGQAANGKGLVWRDDLVQAPPQMGARVHLDGVGEATLTGGTVVRFTTRGGAGPQSGALVVSLVKGSLSVVLRPESAAYLEAGNRSFAASPGTSFRFGLNETEPVAEALSGAVLSLGSFAVQVPAPVLMAAARQAAQNPMQGYKLKPVGGVKGGAVYDVRARSTRQVQVQVTDDRDRPVPDVPILFALGSRIGSFGSTTATTNAQGLATVNFVAGDQAATGEFTATIQGTNVSLTGQLVVSKAIGFWSFQQAAPVLGVAAGALTAVIVTVVDTDDGVRVRATGQPVVRP